MRSAHRSNAKGKNGHGGDERGKASLRKQLKRAQMMTFFANPPPCLIGMEACGSAHFWTRKLMQQGHTVKLMAPQLSITSLRVNLFGVAVTSAGFL